MNVALTIIMVLIGNRIEYREINLDSSLNSFGIFGNLEIVITSRLKYINTF